MNVETNVLLFFTRAGGFSRLRKIVRLTSQTSMSSIRGIVVLRIYSWRGGIRPRDPDLILMLTISFPSSLSFCMLAQLLPKRPVFITTKKPVPHKLIMRSFHRPAILCRTGFMSLQGEHVRTPNRSQTSKGIKILPRSLFELTHQTMVTFVDGVPGCAHGRR
jgi:hypothetical protein